MRDRCRKCGVFPKCEVKGRGIGLLRKSASIVAAGRRSDQTSEGLRGHLVRRRIHRRVDGHHGGREPQKGMPKIGGYVFGTPAEALISSAKVDAIGRDSRPASWRGR